MILTTDYVGVACDWGWGGGEGGLRMRSLFPPPHEESRNVDHTTDGLIMASKISAVPTDLQVGFIGAGKMALALSTGFVRSGKILHPCRPISAKQRSLLVVEGPEMFTSLCCGGLVWDKKWRSGDCFAFSQKLCQVRFKGDLCGLFMSAALNDHAPSTCK